MRRRTASAQQVSLYFIYPSFSQRKFHCIYFFNNPVHCQSILINLPHQQRDPLLRADPSMLGFVDFNFLPKRTPRECNVNDYFGQ